MPGELANDGSDPAQIPSLDRGLVGPVNFTLKQLNYFVVVAELGSVTKASRKVNVSQPSISAALAHLEAVFDTKLFVRHHARGLSMTPAGRQLLGQAKRFLAQAENLNQFASELTMGLGGTLDMACLLTLAPVVLPSVFKVLRQDYPALKMKCHELNIRAILEGLRSGEFELAITYDLNLEEDIAFNPVAAFPAYAIFPEDHRLAQGPQVSLTQLANEPMVLLDLPHTRDYFQSIFLQKDIEPNIVYRTRSPTMVMGMVAAGFGFSLLNARPKTRQTLGGGAYKAVDLAEEFSPLNMGIAHLKTHTLSKSALAFAEEFTKQTRT